MHHRSADIRSPLTREAVILPGTHQHHNGRNRFFEFRRKFIKIWINRHPRPFFGTFEGLARANANPWQITDQPANCSLILANGYRRCITGDRVFWDPASIHEQQAIVDSDSEWSDDVITRTAIQHYVIDQNLSVALERAINLYAIECAQ
jgi:hypothetical protein